MNHFQDAFISYGRVDSKAFCIQLHQLLLEHGLKVWFDQNDIPLGVDFQNQIDDGLEKSDNFLFIIAPHSVNSPYCHKEIELAVRRNKRIIPILHVEKISRDTWQQRNPTENDAAWERYKAKGLHSSYDNMHPAISKINWIYFREGVDDPDKALKGLLELIQRHRNYVRKHTHFLGQALTWERQHRHSRYLLIGEERKEAEAWLKFRFQDEQAPCEPTDLQCEFIGESTQNANNLMNHVFISYGEEDKDVMITFRAVLLRESFTVWTNKNDIKTSEAFQDAINRGIEQADNVVYLISPESLQSTYCQQEINYARSLNKRIISLLIKPTDFNQIPSELQKIQFIDFTKDPGEAGYQLGISELLKTLYEDALYYETHKVLLTKALKWERQNRNASILLRGHNLRHAEAWLKVAKQRSLSPPLPIHDAFITESLNQPEDATQEIFISYSRVDSDLARRLNDALQMQGKTTWFDQESIASGTDFQQEIYHGIETSDNFLFIISPSSVNSPYCADEVDYAMNLNKRIVTVLHRPVPVTELHSGLAGVQWIDFDQFNGDFYANFSELVRTLDTDREHVQYHTKWSQRSLDWLQHNKTEDLLLHGSELAIAMNWLQTAQQHNKQPKPTELQCELITTSEAWRDRQLKLEQQRLQRELRQARFVAIGSMTAGLIMAGLASFAVHQTQTAKIGQIRALIASARANLASHNTFDALAQSVEAAVHLQHLYWFTPPTLRQDLRGQIDGELRQALYNVQELNRLEGHQKAVSSVDFSPNGKMVATASRDGTVRIWDLQGNQISQPSRHQEGINSIVFSPDGQYLATASDDQTVRLWNLQGHELRQFNGHTDAVNSVAFSPNGQYLATTSNDQTMRLWNLQGHELRQFGHNEGWVLSVAFSPDGQLLVTTSADASSQSNIRLWTLQGEEINRFNSIDGFIESVIFSPDGKTLGIAAWDGFVHLLDLQGNSIALFPSEDGDEIHRISFSPDGMLLAATSDSGAVDVWDLQRNTLVHSMTHDKPARGVVFSPDGHSLITTSDDNTARLWNLRDDDLLRLPIPAGEAVLSLSIAGATGYLATQSETATTLWNLQGQEMAQRPITSVLSTAFSPDERYFAIGDYDGVVHLWHQQEGEVQSFQAHEQAVTSLAFSPDGSQLATASEDGTAKLSDLQGNTIASLPGHETFINDTQFSVDGQYVATASNDGTARIWDLQGQKVAQLSGHGDRVISISFSPDRVHIATGSADKTVRLWNLQGSAIALFPEQDTVTSVSFSPDGKAVAIGTEDGTVRLRNLQGQELARFQGHNSPIASLSFSQDGRYLAVITSEGNARLWYIEPFDVLLSKSCNWVRNYLRTNPNVDASDRYLCDDVPVSQANR